MDLLLSPDEEAIVASVTSLLEKSPLVVGDAGWASGWPALAEIGTFGIGVAESQGGFGLGLADEVLLFREFGRHLARGPLLGTTLAVHVALEAGAADLAAGLISGSLTCAYAEPAPGSEVTVDTALSATVRVLDGTGTDLVLVVSPSGAVLTDGQAVHAVASPDALTDPTVEPAVAALAQVQVSAHVPGPRTADRARLLVAGMQTGIAEAALAQAVAYAKSREQFGKPIGMFQAVKHRCADMAVRAEAARFQTLYAALSYDGAPGTDAAQLHVDSAAVVAAEAARVNASDNIIIHGAMGFTIEASPHRLARRSLVLGALLGTSRSAVERVAGHPADSSWA